MFGLGCMLICCLVTASIPGLVGCKLWLTSCRDPLWDVARRIGLPCIVDLISDYKEQIFNSRKCIPQINRQKLFAFILNQDFLTLHCSLQTLPVTEQIIQRFFLAGFFFYVILNFALIINVKYAKSYFLNF